MAEPIADTWRDDTFMHHLRREGYHTELIGKHHFIDRYGVEMDVTADDDEIGRYGFDHACQVVDCGENLHNDCRYTHYLRERGLLDKYRRSQKEQAWKCGDYPFPEEDSEDGFIGRKGCELVEEYDGAAPFYLNLSFVGPHPPYWHPGKLHHSADKMLRPKGESDSESVSLRRAHYMDKCSLIDRYVGRLVEALEQRGMMDNTHIIFTSDHGDNLGDYGIWDKRFFFEQSAGVPLIMAGPQIPRGARGLTGKKSKALVSHVDLYPTILKIAGADAAPLERRPGRDVLAMLHDQPHALRSAAFSQLGTAVMIRTANWKLVFDPEQGGVQHLFNMVTDPSEEANLAGATGYEHVAADLIQSILSHHIRLTQYTHDKEEQRVQRIRVGG